MAAYLPLGEETAGTMPLPIGIAQLVVIVVATKNGGET